MEIKRGDVVLCVAKGDYGKPRPAVVVQSDAFNPTHASLTVCPLTSSLVSAPFFRVSVAPASENGLKKRSQVMVDKVASLSRERIRGVIGRLSGDQMREIGAALILWMDLPR